MASNFNIIGFIMLDELNVSTNEQSIFRSQGQRLCVALHRLTLTTDRVTPTGH